MAHCAIFFLGKPDGYKERRVPLLGTKLGLWSIAFNNRIWALAFFKVVHLDKVRFFFPLTE